MISDTLKKAFNDLDTNDKKDVISSELIYCGELIRILEKSLGINSEFVIKNYNINRVLDENKALDFFYEDIFVIQKELTTLVHMLNIKK